MLVFSNSGRPYLLQGEGQPGTSLPLTGVGDAICRSWRQAGLLTKGLPGGGVGGTGMSAMCPVQATPWATFPPGPDRSGGGGSSSGWKERASERAQGGRTGGRHPFPWPRGPPPPQPPPAQHPPRAQPRGGGGGGSGAETEAFPAGERSPCPPGRPASRGVGQLRRFPPGGLGVGGNRGARSAVEPSRSRLTPAAAGLERADARGGNPRPRPGSGGRGNGTDEGSFPGLGRLGGGVGGWGGQSS